MKTIKIDGVDHKVWKTNLVGYTPPHSFGINKPRVAPAILIGKTNQNLEQYSLPAKKGKNFKSLEMALSLAMSSGCTFKLLMSDRSLTYTSKTFVAPETITRIDTKGQVIHTNSRKSVRAEISVVHGLSVSDRIDVQTAKNEVQDAKSTVESGEVAKKLEKIQGDIESIAKGEYELRKENEELKKLADDGCFKFAKLIDKDDFMALIYILVCGNRKAAADLLHIPHRSFYDRVQAWSGKGSNYQIMSKLVKWRKAVGKKIMVPLRGSLLSSESGGKAENPIVIDAVLTQLAQRNSGNPENLLQQLLEALQEMNAGNWPSICQELIEILKEEIPQ